MTKTYAKTYNFLKKLLLSRNFDKAIKKNTDLIKILFVLKCEERFTALSPVLPELPIIQKYPMANRVKDC